MPDSPGGLEGRQLSLLHFLSQRKGLLAQIYQGYLAVMAQENNGDRIALAAHALRELMEKLPSTGVGIQQDTGRFNLGEKVNELGVELESLKRNSVAWMDEDWLGQIDAPLRLFLGKVQAMIYAHQIQKPKRRKAATELFRELDSQHLPLAQFLEDRKAAEWVDLRSFFDKVAHHRSIPTEAEFLSSAHRIERILLDYFRPETFADFDEIDRLLESNP